MGRLNKFKIITAIQMSSYSSLKASRRASRSQSANSSGSLKQARAAYPKTSYPNDSALQKVAAPSTSGHN